MSWLVKSSKPLSDSERSFLASNRSKYWLAANSVKDGMSKKLDVLDKYR